MDYYINPTSFSAVFTVPTAVTDRYLKFAKAEHIKVLLYILRNMSENFSLNDISENTDVSLFDVKEALLYWADAGILVEKDKPAVVSDVKTPKTVQQSMKPSRTDVAKRGSEDPKIRYLLNQAQLKLGRNLKSNESSTLVWLYDDEGLDVSLILLIIQYAVQHNKANIRFIESVAVDWINEGIDNISDADEWFKNIALMEQSWAVVSKAFGLERRKPSKKESELVFKWIDEWKISKEMLVAAYEACVDAKSKFSFPYVAKIIESWHKNGYTKPEDIKQDTKPEQNDMATFDLNLYQKMLDSEDE